MKFIKKEYRIESDKVEETEETYRMWREHGWLNFDNITNFVRENPELTIDFIENLYNSIQIMKPYYIKHKGK